MPFGLDGKSALAGLLLGGLAEIGKGAYQNHLVNQDIDSQNKSLPTGYQLPHQSGHFFFGDRTQQHEALQNQAKTLMAQYNAHDMQTGDEAQGFTSPYQAPENIATYHKSVVDPALSKTATMEAEQNQKYKQGHNQLQNRSMLQSLLQNMGHPGGQPQQLPPPSYTPGGMMQPGGLEAANPMISAGAANSQYTPPVLPDNLQVTPEDIKEADSSLDKDRTAARADAKDAFERQKYADLKPKRDLELKQAQATLSKTLKELKWIDPKAKAELYYKYKKTGRSGPVDPTLRKIADINQAVQSKQLSPEEGQLAIKTALGVPKPSATAGMRRISASENKKLESEYKNGHRLINSKNPAEREEGRRLIQHYNARTGAGNKPTGNDITQASPSGGLYGFHF